MRRTFEYRLDPTPGQEVRMNAQLASCQRLYNAMVEQRRTAYRSYGISLSRFDQESEIKDVRTLPEYAEIYAHVVQDVARRVDLAYQAFFRRVRVGEKPGYPRFRARERYDSLTYKEPGNGSVKLVGNRVSFSKLASNVKVRLHRPITGTVKLVTVKRKAGKWFVLFSCDNVRPDPTLVAGDGEVGIDVGLVSFATLSTGEAIENPRYARRAAARLASAQRVLARRVRRSHRRRKARAIVARQHMHVVAQRRDHAFKVSRDLVTRFDRIGVENLEVINMVQNRHLARSISDVSWGHSSAFWSAKRKRLALLWCG
ncbi:MAG: RNA-guided endonuclease InsQ/TnpB family protein [Thermoplasmatota archaeon]